MERAVSSATSGTTVQSVTPVSIYLPTYLSIFYLPVYLSMVLSSVCFGLCVLVSKLGLLALVPDCCLETVLEPLSPSANVEAPPVFGVSCGCRYLGLPDPGQRHRSIQATGATGCPWLLIATLVVLQRMSGSSAAGVPLQSLSPSVSER